MKDRKRLVVYSLLALPLIVVAIFLITIDPIARESFFVEFKTATAEQFGYGDEIPAVNSGGDTSNSSESGERPGGGGRAGGFDPAQMFAERDADGDGKLTGDEISQRMRDRLDVIDTDQDGAISLEEMQAGMQGRRRGGGFDPDQMFARRDEDGDGKLTGDEISQRMRENLSDFDTDQDGAITLEEMKAGMQQMMANFGGGGRGDSDDRQNRPARPDRPE